MEHIKLNFDVFLDQHVGFEDLQSVLEAHLCTVQELKSTKCKFLIPATLILRSYSLIQLQRKFNYRIM